MKKSKHPEKFFFSYSFDYLNLYLPACGRSPHTIESYKDTLTVFKNWLVGIKGYSITSFSFADFTADLMFEFLDWLSLAKKNSDSTKNQRLERIGSYIDYCIFRDVSLSSLKFILSGIKPLKEVKRIRDTLTPEQVTLLINSCSNTPRGKRDRLILLVLYETAMRVSELTNLTINNLFLDTDAPFIHLLGKGKKERTIPLVGDMPNILREYIENVVKPEETEHLFFTRHNGIPTPISSRAVQEMINRYADKLREKDSSIPKSVYPHMFRRSKATTLYQSGMQLEQVSSLLGHSQLETTRVYARSSIEQIRTSMEKVIPASELNQEPLWKGKTEDILTMIGLR